MGVFHFLNVKEGDCSIIQHPSGRVTVIDVSNARHPVANENNALALLMKSFNDSQRVKGNFGQKDYPVNPIQYMRDHGITDVFRLVITHPDMDHMDGIKDLCEAFPPTNFWDTNNNCTKEDWGNNARYREEDWRYYENLHHGRLNSSPKRLAIHAGQRAMYYNQNSDNSAGGDGLHILAPTEALVSSANECDDHNDSSYVILYRSNGGRIIIAGDSHDSTWEHIIANHRSDVENVDVLVAPHHGRHSDRDFSFLDVLKPKLTLFGNAPSEHLAYGEWSRRGLPIITNNQADCVVIDTDSAAMDVYVTNETFAKAVNAKTFWSAQRRGYYVGQVKPVEKAA
jgi:competence protein ComEC